MNQDTNIKHFQYYAFISYCRKDSEWAKWLQNKIETYKIPPIVRKESGNKLPKYIRPIFLDTTDMGIGDIHQSLSNELEDSKNLVVICSPEAANSIWVNNEIEKYKFFGRENRIIPFIINGTPKPKAITELQCYPPSLDKDNLGAS